MAKEKAVGITGAAVLAIIMAVYAIIKISQQAFHFFFTFGLILLIISIIVFLIEMFFRDKAHLEFYEYISLWTFGIAIIFLILAVPFYAIGYGFGNTQAGLAIQDTGDTLVDAEQQVEETFDEAINEIVNSGCETLDEQSCRLLRTTASSAQDIQEFARFAENLKGKAIIVNKIIE
jgi:hypothetical protein